MHCARLGCLNGEIRWLESVRMRGIGRGEHLGRVRSGPLIGLGRACWHRWGWQFSFNSLVGFLRLGVTKVSALCVLRGEALRRCVRRLGLWPHYYREVMGSRRCVLLWRGQRHSLVATLVVEHPGGIGGSSGTSDGCGRPIVGIVCGFSYRIG